MKKKTNDHHRVNTSKAYDMTYRFLWQLTFCHSIYIREKWPAVSDSILIESAHKTSIHNKIVVLGNNLNLIAIRYKVHVLSYRESVSASVRSILI